MEIITVNPRRTARVAELLNDFRTLQYWITEGPKGPVHPDDYYAAGWVELRQCLEDGKHILDCAADITVPMAHGGPDEQVKAQLQQYVIHFPILSFIMTLSGIFFRSRAKIV